MERRILTASIALALLVSGCGKGPEPQARQEAAKQEAAKQLQDAGKQMEQAAKGLEAAAKKGGEGMADAMAKMGAAVGGAVTGAAKSMGTAVEPVRRAS